MSIRRLTTGKTAPGTIHLRLYRILRRTCKSFTDSNSILLQQNLEATDWGRHILFSSPLSNGDSSINEVFRVFHAWHDDAIIDNWYSAVTGKPKSNLCPSSCWTSKEDLQLAIRKAFSSEYNGGVDTTRIAILANQALEEQRQMWKSSSTATTQQVRVTATSRCIGTSSAVGGVLVPPQHPASAILQSKYRFAYRIRIENLSENNVQLLGRYWRIQEYDASAMEEEPVIVDAPITGAVGQLPVLQPGQVFEYMSGADLATTRGEMRGHFYMAKVSDDAKSANSGDDVQYISDEDKFEAIVAPFPLLAQD